MKGLGKWGLLSALILSHAAQALTLSEARQQGRVGETFTGYLAAVSQDRETLALVEKVNQARAQAYRRLADENQLTTGAVAGLAGQKLVSKAQPGEYVRGLNGQWLKKQ